MRYTRYLNAGEKDKWLNLEVTLGPDEVWIETRARQLTSFIHTFDANESRRFQEFSGFTNSDIAEVKIHNRNTLISLMLKLFIDRIGINIIREADPSLGGDIRDIYLTLAERLFSNDSYPTDIYIHSIYRKRGTPKTWLSLSDESDPNEIEAELSSRVKNIVTYVNHNMPSNRRLRTSAEIDQQLIFVMTKYTGPRVALSLTRNIEIPTASHTFIVYNKRTNQIGVVSGAHKEIGYIHYYLRYRLFRNRLASRRNELMQDGNEVVRKLVEQPESDDGLILKALEVRNANLPDSPNFKLSSQDNASIYAAADQLRNAWEQSQLSDIKTLEYHFMQRTIGLYCRYDAWDRVVINTRSTSITNYVEGVFLDRVSDRLNGLNIKTTRLIQSPYTHTYILDKLLGQKTISIEPAIPQAADEALLLLLQKKLVVRPPNTIRRVCFSCFTTSWQDIACPNCGSEDMRIVGEFMSLELVEREFIRQLNASIAGQLGKMVSYVQKRQRNNYQKSLIAVTSESKHSNVFIVYVGSKYDIAFIDDLVDEGFGVVAIVDPKMDTARDQLTTIGVDNVGLIKILVHILYAPAEALHPLLAPILAQHEKMLQRIITRAQYSLRQILQKPTGYQPSQFEVDLKNMLQALVPDVLRLGTEHSGQKVPDGYLRYGLQAYTRNRRGRLFGWDAKYSENSSYILGTADLRKQKGYIDWLTDIKGTPYQFGSLGIYAIISNFSRRNQFETVMNGLARYSKLPRNTRIVVIEDLFIAKILEWALANWEQVLINNSAISKEVFTFVRRSTRKSYTVTDSADWERLEQKLDGIINT